MIQSHPLLGTVQQIAYLTDDIESTASAWAKMAGVGPWTLMEGVNLPAIYDGEDVTFKIDVALSYQGDVQIELINPLCDTPSPYAAHKQAGLWGLHHLQFACTDMDKTLSEAKAQGLNPICEMNASAGGRYAYIKGHGVWFEIMEPNGSLDMFFNHIKSTCENWDGETLFAS